MKIAVLIPCYNVEKFLAECLDSVLAAAVPGMEVFCCNDGSTDGTMRVLEDYSAEYPEVHFISQPNAGVSAARNRLLDGLPVEYDAATFVDADDTVRPGYFSRLVEAMERTDSDVAEYALDLVTSETVVDDTTVFWLKRTNPGVRSAIVGKLIRRPVLEKVRLRAGLSYEEDLMFSYEVNANIRRKVVLPGFPYFYRPNPDSATQNINWRRYVESACARVEYFASEFLDKHVVPDGLIGEFVCEMVSDAFRMCIRKNLKKNRDLVLRRELFIYAADFLDRLCVGHPTVFSANVGLIPKLFVMLCRKRYYRLSSALIMFT